MQSNAWIKWILLMKLILLLSLMDVKQNITNILELVKDPPNEIGSK